MKTNDKLRRLTKIGVLSAIVVVLGMTPIGFIPIGPTKATIMHIPVIIGAILEGPIAGMIIGLLFGLFSIFQAITQPTPVSFVFLNPLVSVIPRILIGLTSFYAYKFVKGMKKKHSKLVFNIILAVIVLYLGVNLVMCIRSDQIFNAVFNAILIVITIGIGFFVGKKYGGDAMDVVISAMVGTFTNTFLVLFLIYLLYAERFVIAMNGNIDMARKIIGVIGLVNGIPEMIIAIIITTAVIKGLESRLSKR